MLTQKIFRGILATVLAISAFATRPAHADENVRAVELVALDEVYNPTGSVFVMTGSDELVYFKICPVNHDCVTTNGIEKQELSPLLKKLKDEAVLKKDIKTFSALSLAIALGLFGLFTGHDILAALGFFPVGTLCVKAAGSPNATERCSTKVEESLSIIEDVKNVRPGKIPKIKMRADIGEFVRFLKKAQAKL